MYAAPESHTSSKEAKSLQSEDDEEGRRPVNLGPEGEKRKWVDCQGVKEQEWGRHRVTMQDELGSEVGWWEVSRSETEKKRESTLTA